MNNRPEYETAFLTAQGQLGEISELLFQYPDPESEVLKYTHLADMEAVNKELDKIIAFLKR